MRALLVAALAPILFACKGKSLPPLQPTPGDLTVAGTQTPLKDFAAELQVSAKGTTVSLDGVLPKTSCDRFYRPRYLRGEGALLLELNWSEPEVVPIPCEASTFTAFFTSVPPGTYTVWLTAPAEAQQSRSPTGSPVDTIRIGRVTVRSGGA